MLVPERIPEDMEVEEKCFKSKQTFGVLLKDTCFGMEVQSV